MITKVYILGGGFIFYKDRAIHQQRWWVALWWIHSGVKNDFKYFLNFHPETLGKWSNLTLIIFRWVGEKPPPNVAKFQRKNREHQPSDFWIDMTGATTKSTLAAVSWQRRFPRDTLRSISFKSCCETSVLISNANAHAFFEKNKTKNWFHVSYCWRQTPFFHMWVLNIIQVHLALLLSSLSLREPPHVMQEAPRFKGKGISVAVVVGGSRILQGSLNNIPLWGGDKDI